MNEGGGYRTRPELLLDRAMDRMLHRSVAADGLMCEEHEYVGAFDRPYKSQSPDRTCTTNASVFSCMGVTPSTTQWFKGATISVARLTN